MKHSFKIALLAGIGLGAISTASQAQVDEVTLSVVGSLSGLPLYRQFEEPFWTKTLPEVSGGKISVEMTAFNQLGSNGSDVYRLLGDGVFDVGMTVFDYTVADAPELEALDVPLVALTAEEMKAAVDAARPWVADSMRERFNSHLLAIAPFPPQVVFCRGEVNSLDDIRGKRIRGSGRMTTQFIEALGGEGVNLAFGEVPGALQNGVIDCAITGAGSGYSAGWWESSSHLLVIPLGGWDPVGTAVNLDRWESLSEETRQLITEQVKTNFEDPAWADAQGALERDIACLSGGECAAGAPGDMTIVYASDEDMQTALTALKERVLPDWAARAGADWVKRWNETVGEVVGIEIAAN
ncbi:MAG: C4-dicarboxylate ABC transporter substrate-binding protein [Salinarimonadaceae bacterium]|nr:MAG: C4-dicarboxylate ABC transporter substrate-binding protein [Salinarimonadaceae bacterium]